MTSWDVPVKTLKDASSQIGISLGLKSWRRVASATEALPFRFPRLIRFCVLLLKVSIKVSLKLVDYDLTFKIHLKQSLKHLSVIGISEVQKFMYDDVVSEVLRLSQKIIRKS